MSRANPFDDLSDFNAAPKARPVEAKTITRIAEEHGFPSRQPPQAELAPLQRPARRRYVTGRNRQINIKATNETVERFIRMADERNVPFGELLDLALDAIEAVRRTE